MEKRAQGGASRKWGDDEQARQDGRSRRTIAPQAGQRGGSAESTAARPARRKTGKSPHRAARPSSLSAPSAPVSMPPLVPQRRGRHKRAHGRRSRPAFFRRPPSRRSEEHTSELQSLMRISYAVFRLKKKKHNTKYEITNT